MPSKRDKPKRWWRPRFSLRTLVILVTLVCCYVACWGPTKKWGVADVSQHLCDNHVDPGYATILPSAQHSVFAVSATMPFVVNSENLWGGRGSPLEYYFWFFGYVAKLPYERDVPLRPPTTPKDSDLHPAGYTQDDEGVWWPPGTPGV